jgi:type IV fimbrial biogenesis protein FimT
MSETARASIVREASGLTALDLVITLAIIALLLATAVPALKDYSMNQRMKSALARFHASLTMARSEAINLGGRVVVCPAAGNTACRDNGEWNLGWMVFLDRNDDRELQADEPLLVSEPGAEGLGISGSRHRTRLRFFANGTAPGSNAGITFCDARGAAEARQITLSASGRIRVKTAEESDVAACEA